MTDQDFSTVRNRTAKLDIAATLNGSPWPLSGVTLKLAMKKSTGDRDADAMAVKTIGNGITVTDAIGGMARIEINPADTVALPAAGVSRVYWDLAGIDANDRWELGRGHFRVEADVVHDLA